jgi:hypothetical protein
MKRVLWGVVAAALIAGCDDSQPAGGEGRPELRQASNFDRQCSGEEAAAILEPLREARWKEWVRLWSRRNVEPQRAVTLTLYIADDRPRRPLESVIAAVASIDAGVPEQRVVRAIAVAEAGAEQVARDLEAHAKTWTVSGAQGSCRCPIVVTGVPLHPEQLVCSPTEASTLQERLQGAHGTRLSMIVGEFNATLTKVPLRLGLRRDGSIETARASLGPEHRNLAEAIERYASTWRVEEFEGPASCEVVLTASFTRPKPFNRYDACRRDPHCRILRGTSESMLDPARARPCGSGPRDGCTVIRGGGERPAATGEH